MSRCDTLREDLKAYQDGRLSLTKRLRVRRHLKRCESCRQELAQILQIGKELRQMDRDGEISQLDPGLRARILASIPEGLPEPPDGIPSLRRRSRSLTLWGGLAAAALVVLVFYPRHASEKSHSLLLGKYAQDYDEAKPQGTMKSSGAPASVNALTAAKPQAPAEELQNLITVTRDASGDSRKGRGSFGDGRSFAGGGSFGGRGQSSPAAATALPPAGFSPSVMDQVKSMGSPMRMRKGNTQNDTQDMLVLQVDDLKEGQAKVHRIASAVQGEIVLGRQRGGRNYYLEMKVPAARYADARVQLVQLQSEQKMASQSISTLAGAKIEGQQVPLPVAPTTRGAGKTAAATKSKHMADAYEKQAYAFTDGKNMPARILHITLEQKPSPSSHTREEGRGKREEGKNNP